MLLGKMTFKKMGKTQVVLLRQAGGQEGGEVPFNIIWLIGIDLQNNHAQDSMGFR